MDTRVIKWILKQIPKTIGELQTMLSKYTYFRVKYNNQNGGLDIEHKGIPVHILPDKIKTNTFGMYMIKLDLHFNPPQSKYDVLKEHIETDLSYLNHYFKNTHKSYKLKKR